MKKKLVPELRFPEFSGEWEEKKLGDISNYKSSSISLNSLDEYKGKELYPIYDANSICKFVDYYMENEDYISIIKDGAGVGRLRLCKGKSSILGTMGYMSNNNKTKLLFLFYLMQTINFNIYVTGTTIPHIYYKDYKRYNTRIPSIKEQEKVANFFNLIDKKIEKQEEKIASIEDYKRGMMQKLFPKKGDNVPELRFKGFTDPWEQRKLDDIADVRDGTHDSPQYYSEGHPFITSKNVKDGDINYDDIQYISDADFEEINKRSKVDKNDILMGMIGTIGNIALVREKPDFAIKNVALIKDTKKVYYVYLYHCLQSSSILNQLSEGMDGGTQKFIALNKIRNLIISVPKYEEQLTIGRFFDNLDNLITLHQRKLEELKELKKGFMQKMFI